MGRRGPHIGRHVRIVGALLCLIGIVAACGDDDGAGGADDATDPATCLEAPAAESTAGTVEAVDSSPGTSITLVTHESFAVSPGVLEAFTERTGIEVSVLAAGDAGTVVSQSIISRDAPLGDVLFGVDNTLLCRALLADLFVPYEAAALAEVPDELELDPHHRVTPVDYGDVCVNWWADDLEGEPPTSLEDLADPRFAGELVTPSPETSSPGLAFLLATVARFGEDGWEAYWEQLRANDVLVTTGWNDAYYGEFVAGGGDRALVTSYATSPAAEVVFADPPVETPPTGVLTDGCFRQIEFAGVLAGTQHPGEAAALVEHLLSPEFQADIPLSMFVFPARADTELPEVFTRFAAVAEEPLELDPVTIEAGRDRWTERWTEIVLG
jgi:thiamine transport system substrate-binding protein